MTDASVANASATARRKEPNELTSSICDISAPRPIEGRTEGRRQPGGGQVEHARPIVKDQRAAAVGETGRHIVAGEG